MSLENIVSFLLKKNFLSWKNKKLKNSNLDSHSMTGLIEAKESFSIMKFKNKRIKYIDIGLKFEISMLANETQLLSMVKSFFCCGNVFIKYNNCIIQLLWKILVKYLKFW